MKFHCRRNKQFIKMKRLIKHVYSEFGQSTVEFAIVTAALLVVVIALGLF